MKKILILSFTLLVSCTHNPPKVGEAKSCHKLVQDLPKFKEQTLLKKIEKTGKSGLHYMAVGVGAVSDIVVIFSAGIAIGVTVCSPALFADSVNRGSSNMTSSCIHAFMNHFNFSEIYDFPITEFAINNTYQLTCLNLDLFEEKLKETLKCRDDSLSEDELKRRVRAITSDKKLNGCLDPNLKT